MEESRYSSPVSFEDKAIRYIALDSGLLVRGCVLYCLQPPEEHERGGYNTKSVRDPPDGPQMILTEDPDAHEGDTGVMGLSDQRRGQEQLKRTHNAATTKPTSIAVLVAKPNKRCRIFGLIPSSSVDSLERRRQKLR